MSLNHLAVPEGKEWARNDGNMSKGHRSSLKAAPGQDWKYPSIKLNEDTNGLQSTEQNTILGVRPAANKYVSSDSSSFQ